jgi:hypothetical protein
MSIFIPRRALVPEPVSGLGSSRGHSLDCSTEPPIDPRRYLCLAVVVAAQFMFVVDAFIVNVAIPSILAALAMLGLLVLCAALSLRWMRRVG